MMDDDINLAIGSIPSNTDYSDLGLPSDSILSNTDYSDLGLASGSIPSNTDDHDYSAYAGPVACSIDDRDFSQFSDHVTVWIDQYIGVENSYDKLKSKFDDNIQVLKSNNPAEHEIDDDTMLCTDPAFLKKLSVDCYCLKYFSTPEEGLEYILANPRKKIFFISSGTIGKIIVPQIVNLSQIQGIYIFCGNISHHVEWASDYVENISAILEHQDNLLERLTRDIAVYVDGKGDQYEKDGEFVKARNCYSWAKKLLIRGQMLGVTGTSKLIDKITKKIDQAQISAVSPMED